jgi:pyridoxal phosphate phosphatase PHOSPHO2
MCKGEELSAFLEEHGDYDQVIYVGDGSNDFCPVVRLREYVILGIWCIYLIEYRQDMVLARIRRGLQGRIAKEGASAGLKCKVVYWDDAWEIEEAFGKL